MNPVGRRLVLAIALVGTVTGAATAPAAEKPPKALSVTTLEEIRVKLEKSLALQQKALEALPERDAARKVLFDAYVPLRSAHAQMVVHMSHRKVQFPTYDIAYKQIADAREHLLSARGALAYPMNHVLKGETVEQIAYRNLAECRRLVTFVLQTTF